MENLTQYQNLSDIEKWAGNPGKWIEQDEIVQFKNGKSFVIFSKFTDGSWIYLMSSFKSLLRPLPISETETKIVG